MNDKLFDKIDKIVEEKKKNKMNYKKGDLILLHDEHLLGIIDIVDEAFNDYYVNVYNIDTKETSLAIVTDEQIKGKVVFK